MPWAGMACFVASRKVEMITMPPNRALQRVFVCRADFSLLRGQPLNRKHSATLYEFREPR